MLYKESKRTSDLNAGASSSKNGGDGGGAAADDDDEGGSESDGDLNGMSGSNESTPRKGVKRGASDTSPEASPAKKVSKAWKFWYREREQEREREIDTDDLFI